jgi:Bifunctional DNA primase/polymerase, N-terminal
VTPDILTVARWLQDRHGLYLFAVDHPGRPECGGSHRECDGQRGKHPGGQWSRLATMSPRLIGAQLAGGPWNLGVACKLSLLLGVDEDRPGAFAEFAASIGEVIVPTFTVTTSKGCHYYYRQAEGAPLGNGRGQLAGHGIDIRGGGSSNGGYLVGPGSVH